MIATRDWETTLVRLLFWACWTGMGFCWFIFFFGEKLGVTFRDVGVATVLPLNFFAGLGCGTVLCRRCAPKLTLLGWLMLSPGIFFLMLGIVFGLFSWLFR